MSDDSKPHDSLPPAAELRPELLALADTLRAELLGGDNPCAAFTRFTSEAFHQAHDVKAAVPVLLEMMQNRRAQLGSMARVVDVTAELQHGSDKFAREVVQVWDQPREEHKLFRLTDALLSEPELYGNTAAQHFILELARRLSLPRPEIARKLIDAVPALADTEEMAHVKTWLKAGEYLRAQNEAVRFFWDRHLRHPDAAHDWSRQSVRPAVTAVRTSAMDEEVRDLFRASVPADVWEGTQVTVKTQPVAIPQRPVVMPEAQMAAPAVIRPTISSSVRRVQSGAALKNIDRGLPWAHIAAGVVVIATLAMWFMSDRRSESIEVASTPSQRKVAPILDAPSLPPVSLQPQPKHSSPEPKAIASTKPKVVPAVPASQPEKEPALPAAVAMTSKAHNPVPPAPAANKPVVAAPKAAKPAEVATTAKTSAPATTAAAIQPLVMPKPLSFAKPVDLPSHPPLRAITQTRVSTPNSAPTPSTKSPTVSALPPRPTSEPLPASALPAPVESVARPAMITDHDRWVMHEAHDIAQRYPELIAMQHAVVTGTWNDTIMRVDGVRPVTADPARYAALVRWLVIDPPLPAETRKIVLRAWTKVASPDECIDLWEKLIKGKAAHVADIGQAALEFVNRPGQTLSANQRFRLHKIAAGDVD